MTQQQFAILCGSYLIEPEMALENPAIVDALRSRDDTEVERVLREEF